VYSEFFLEPMALNLPDTQTNYKQIEFIALWSVQIQLLRLIFFLKNERNSTVFYSRYFYFSLIDFW